MSEIRSLTKRIVIAGLCLSCLSPLAPGPAVAETGRELGGYRFMPSPVVEDPFIVTQFQNFTGLSLAMDVDFPLLIIDGVPPDTLFALNGNFVFVTVDFEYRQVVHPRVALFVEGQGASRVGTTGQALLSQGVTVITSGRGGVLVELWRNDRFVISGSAAGGYANTFLIDFIGFAEDILSGNIRNASIVRNVEGGTFDAGLIGAWAINEWAGVHGLGQFGYSGGQFESETLRWRAAANGGVDFGQRGGTPVGLQLGFDLTHFDPQFTGSEAVLSVAGGVYYTGREDFSLGFDVRRVSIPLKGWDFNLNPLSFGIAMRYYF